MGFTPNIPDENNIARDDLVIMQENVETLHDDNAGDTADPNAVNGSRWYDDNVDGTAAVPRLKRLINGIWTFVDTFLFQRDVKFSSYSGLGGRGLRVDPAEDGISTYVPTDLNDSVKASSTDTTEGALDDSLDTADGIKKTITNPGADEALEVALDVNSLTEQASASGDMYVFYDTSTGTHKKIDHDDLPGSGGGASNFVGLGDTDPAFPVGPPSNHEIPYLRDNTWDLLEFGSNHGLPPIYGLTAGAQILHTAAADPALAAIGFTATGESITTNASASSPASGTWTDITPGSTLPNTRDNSAIVGWGTSVFLFGGFDPSVGNVDDVWEYDTTLGTWSQIVPSTSGAAPGNGWASGDSAGRNGHSMVVMEESGNDYIYISPGRLASMDNWYRTPDYGVSAAPFLSFEQMTNNLPPAPYTPGTIRAGAVSGSFYVCTRQGEVFEHNGTIAGAWTTHYSAASQAPWATTGGSTYLSLFSLAVDTTNNKMYVIGGLASTGETDDVWETNGSGVNIIGTTWIARTGTGLTGYEGAAVCVGGDIHSFIGIHNSSTSGSHRYSTDGGITWSAFTPISWSGRNRFCTCTLSNDIYLFGGYLGSSTYDNDLHRFVYTVAAGTTLYLYQK